MYKENYHDFDYDYQESLINRIKVNKKKGLTNSDILKYYNYHHNKNRIKVEDCPYYTMEKKNKIPYNRNNLLFNTYNISILSQEKDDNNIIKLPKYDKIKKTINLYSNENQKKEGNIIEELQNNKYLRPMLGNSNIDIKLLKCQIESPVKNISPFSLKKYINNYEILSKYSKSPEKDIIGMQSEDKINMYNLNDKSSFGKIDINVNNLSSNNKTSKFKDINNSLSNKDSFRLNKNLMGYIPTNIKKYSATYVGKIQNEKKLYKSKKNQKKREINYGKPNKDENEINIIYNSNRFKKSALTIDNFNNKSKNKNKNDFICGGNKDNKLLQIYKKKLIEEFIIVLKKFISKYLKNNFRSFFRKLKKYKFKSHSKNKIYYKKNTNKCNKKINLSRKNKEIQNKNLIFNYEIDKEAEKKTKVITTDTSNNNFNLNNKSFSNEIKSSSLSFNYISNLLSNNNKLNNHSSSFLFIDHRHKNSSQSPEETFKKSPINKIKTKTIIYKKRKSGSLNRSPSEGGLDNFVYRKKNLNNDNLYVNKNYNKYLNIINRNKKEEIIGIDINLGKPIRVINDHSPLEELYLERNKSDLFQFNSISTKFKKNKKNKSNSRTKKKYKPPLQTKKFANEEEDEKEDYINNFYVENYKTPYTLKRKKENNYMNEIYLDNSLKEFFSKNINKSIMSTNIENREKIIKGNNLLIRINSLFFYDYKNKNNDKFKSFKKEKNISLFLKNHKKNTKLKNKYKNEQIKHNEKLHKKKKVVSKLIINCTKFFIKILIKLIKRKVFFQISKWNKSYKKKNINRKK